MSAISQAWGDAYPWVKKACRETQGKMHPGSVLHTMASGNQWLWLLKRGRRCVGVVCTQIIEYTQAPTGVMRVAEIWLAATDQGTMDMEGARSILRSLEGWAVSEGCVRIEIHGRSGWGRLFSDYQEAYRVFGKELGDG